MALAVGLILVVGGPIGSTMAVDLTTAVLSVFAALPAILVVGNHLSVRHPWRMSFRIGGAPPGAMASAFAQLLVLCGMALLLWLPILIARFAAAAGREDAHLWQVAAITVITALAWLGWGLSLGGAARAFDVRREHLLGTLTREEA
jgi:hypothetical protein